MSTATPLARPAYFWALAVFLVVGFGAFVNFFAAAVVFTHPAVDRTLTVSGVIAPLTALALAGSAMRWAWLRWLCYAAVLVLSGLAFLLSVLIVAFDTDEERLATYPAGGSRLVLVRTDCGATCSTSGLRLYQDWPVAPGVVRRRHVQSWYPAESATIVPFGSDSVRVTLPARRAGVAPRVEVIRLVP